MGTWRATGPSTCNPIPQNSFLPLYNRLTMFMCDKKVASLQSTVALACRHLAIVDIPLIWTATKSPAKITDIRLKQNSHYYGLSILRTYGRLSRSRQLNFIILTLVVMDVNQHLLTFRQNYLKLQFISSSFSLRLCVFGWKVNTLPINYRTYLQKTIMMYLCT